MAKREAEAKKRKKIKDHKERLREINSLRRKNLCLIGVPEGAKRDLGPEAYLNKSYLRTSLIWGGKQPFSSRT